ncbi:MAG: PASTA domain-containing protein [Nitrospirae bacterium]|nr:PASTA domain-containing protein [Nitrospirota bacterium]
MLNVKKIMQTVAVFFALLALVFVSAIVTMKVVTSGRTVAVPDVSGRDVTDAIGALKDAGLEIKVDREEFHPTAPEGTVISQVPAPGSKVKKGRNISVVLSLGRQEITVPELYGESFRRAQIVLKQAGLTLGEVARVPSSEPGESVIAQEPAAQSVIQRGGALDLLVSSGPAPGMYITPDITGKTLGEATGILAQLSAGVSQTGKSGVVTSQDPPAGYPLQAGDTVKVTLGNGTSAGKPGAAPPQKPGATPAGKPVQPANPAPAQKTDRVPAQTAAPAPPAQKPAPPSGATGAPPAPMPEQTAVPVQKPAKQPSRQIIRDPLGGNN